MGNSRQRSYGSSKLCSSIESLEARSLLTFALPDPTFGQAGGRAAIDAALRFRAGGGFALTAIADGRLVATNKTGVVYLRGDGNLDPKRGEKGSEAISIGYGAAIDVAVDPATGKIAVLRNTKVSSGVALELLDAKGNVVATRSAVYTSDDAKITQVAFGPDGGIYVLSERTRYLENTDPPIDQEIFADVQKFDASLHLKTHYGTGGIASIQVAALDTRNDYYHDVGFGVDGSGRVLIWATMVRGGMANYLETGSVYRLNTSAALDPTYGVDGRVTLYENRIGADPVKSISTGVRQVGADGEYYQLTDTTTSHPSDADAPASLGVELRRVSVDGHHIDVIDAGGGVRSQASSFSFTVAPDRSVYVAITSELRHFLADSLQSDPTWSQFGNVAFVASSQGSGNLTVDAAGRLLLADGSSDWDDGKLPSIMAIKGVGETVTNNLPAGKSVLLGDGVLVINGTTKADVISLRRKRSDVLVEINGKLTKYKSSQIRGAIIRAGNGNDLVTTGSVTPNVFVEAGAGSDHVIAGGTLVGGSGDDTLEGAVQADFIYGQAGNDRLIGNGNSDALFGGDGNDELFAAQVNAGGDQLRDYLSGGRGSDTLHRDRGLYADDAAADSDTADIFY